MARTLATLLMAVGLAQAAAAEQGDALLARDDRIAELESKLDAVVDELARLRTQVAVPDEPELKSAYGLGPAASRVYGVDRGLSIGGYGEAFYTNYLDDGDAGEIDEADMLRLVLYFGYKFTDKIVFNSEIEIEHADEIFVEFAQLDFSWRSWANFRAGLLLLPVGFVNEIHEPPFFFGVKRPLTETRIIPTTWRENGVGVFGRIGETLEYRSYVVNGFDATGYSASGVRGGRQKGSQALADDLAWVGRVDWTPVPEWLLGGSLYVGKSGQGQDGPTGERLPGARLTLGELHAQYESGPFFSRALFSMSHLSNAGELNRALGNPADAAIADLMFGGYAEVAYDIWPLLFGEDSKYLAPFFRVEYVDTQAHMPSGFDEDRTQAAWLYTPGIQFKPIPNVVLKMEYRNFQQREGNGADELSFGFGYVF